MSLLSAADIAGARIALEVTLVHTCTITPMVAGTEDAEGNVPLTPGSPVTGVPCTYSTVARVVRDEGGTTVVNVPTLTVSATAVIAIGSRVTAITDSLGGTPPGAAGTYRVERVLDDTAGLGASLLPVYELRAGAVSA